MATPISSPEELLAVITEVEVLLTTIDSIRNKAARLLVDVLQTEPALTQGQQYDPLMKISGNNAYKAAVRLLDKINEE